MHFFNKGSNYLAIVLFTLFSLFGPFNVCIHADLSQAILDGINEDRAIRRKAPRNPASIVTVKKLDVKGAFSSAIYEVELAPKPGQDATKKKFIICKQFKDAEQFEGEVWSFSHLRDYFKGLNEWRGVDHISHYVSFVKYKGRTEYTDENNQTQKLILLEKAKGAPLRQLLLSYALQDNNYLFWKNIGTNLAKFHLAFGEVKGNTYVSSVHGDFQFFNNIFVDGFRLNFIDYATFINSLNPKKDISSELEAIFGGTYKNFTGEVFEKIKNAVYKAAGSFEQAYQCLNTFAERIHHVFSEIMQGYIDEFSRKGLNVNIDDNNQATLISHAPAKRNLQRVPVSQIVTKDSFFEVNPHLIPRPAPMPAPVAVPALAPVPAANATRRFGRKAAPVPAPVPVPSPAANATRRFGRKAAPVPAPVSAPVPAPVSAPSPAANATRRFGRKAASAPAPVSAPSPAANATRRFGRKAAPVPAPVPVPSPAANATRRFGRKAASAPAPVSAPSPAANATRRFGRRATSAPAPVSAPSPAANATRRFGRKAASAPAPVSAPRAERKAALIKKRRR